MSTILANLEGYQEGVLVGRIHSAVFLRRIADAEIAQEGTYRPAIELAFFTYVLKPRQS